MDWLSKKILSVEDIRDRVKEIIDVVIDPAGYMRREICARTIYVMLYCFSVDGQNWIRPATITLMTDEQSIKLSKEERLYWLDRVQNSKNKSTISSENWYKPNTRESIRDETIRSLVNIGAVIERQGLATTSPAPRYSLQQSFAELFNPDLQGNLLSDAIALWRTNNLSPAHLARLKLAQKVVNKEGDGVIVKLPNGETRVMKAGKSSELTKAVIEDFASRFLKEPVVLLISESANKIITRDDDLCKTVGFNIDVSTLLPDVILADIGLEKVLFVFVECVATDGPFRPERVEALLEKAIEKGYSPSSCAFVTVFEDRNYQTSKRLFPSVAWNTYVWYKNEPDNIVYLFEGVEKEICLNDFQIMNNKT